VVNEINESNSKILHAMNIDPKVYNISVDTYSSYDSIKKKIQLTEKLLADFMRDDKMEITIPEELSKNFLKIITNIFYLNLQKVTREIKLDIFDKNENTSEDALKNIISVCYEKNLKATRKKVITYFKVKSTELKGRTLLRAYTNLLPSSHPDRLTYINYYNIKELIQEHLAKRIYNQTLLEETTEPRNEIIDLEGFISENV
jgi:hypothetical protein